MQVAVQIVMPLAARVVLFMWFFVFSHCDIGIELQELIIREFSFHELNANLLWPGTFAFAEWLVQNPSWIQGRKCIELGRYNYSIA